MKTTIKLRISRFDSSQDGMMWSIEVGNGGQSRCVSGIPDKFTGDIFNNEAEMELTPDCVHKLFDLLCDAMSMIKSHPPKAGDNGMGVE